MMILCISQNSHLYYDIEIFKFVNKYNYGAIKITFKVDGIETVLKVMVNGFRRCNRK